VADLLAAEEMKRACAAPNQASLREYADGKRREAVKVLLKCQQDEFRRGQILTQKGYGMKAVEVFATPKDREEALAGRLLEKSYDTPLFSPKELKKDFTEPDARKSFAGLFTKEPAAAEKDAVVNFGVGLELTQKSHPNELKPDASQALAEIRKELSGDSDKPISDIHKALCHPPYGLTQEMANLYLFTLVKLGGYELALNPATQIQLTNGKPLPANKLTAHTLGLCKWNSQMDKALLGARIVAAVQKGWNDVLPYARVLDDSLKPTSTPDEELQRNDQLLIVLARLKEETPTVGRSLKALADKLEGALPKSFTELIARLNILVATTSYQEFDAAVRESYATPEKFKEAFGEYEKARKLRERDLQISQARDYLAAACDVDKAIELDRNANLNYFKLDTLFTSPHVIPARLDSFDKWKGNYVQSYRKAHRAFYESLGEIAFSTHALRPRVIALNRLNTIIELGPPLTGTGNLSGGLDQLESTAWICPDAAGAEVAGTNAVCPKCDWTPAKALPQIDCDRLSQLITQGLADRIQRLKDASIAAILKKAADDSDRADLKSLLEIIQIADADKLVGVITDDLVTFLRKLLQEANIVHETVALLPILNQIGAIEEERIEESLSKLTGLLRTAIKNAKAKHGAGKRVRVLFRLDEPGTEN
jgi:tetratricopeptide (TPR) repeat protein